MVLGPVYSADGERYTGNMRTHQQVLFIHGGMTFNSKTAYLRYLRTRPISLVEQPRWSRGYLTTALGPRFEVIRPRMPLQDNARYADWKIAFERYVPLLSKNAIVVGASLGGVFLAKYLSEHRLRTPLRSVFLVCPPFDNTHSIASDKLYGGFVLQKDLSLIRKNVRSLTMLFSHDDPSVPPYHMRRYAEKLPWATTIMYYDKNGHFRVPTFPEIISMIKKVST